jgi:hypothetical protein
MILLSSAGEREKYEACMYLANRKKLWRERD